jgi:hypothetical protein
VSTAPIATALATTGNGMTSMTLIPPRHRVVIGVDTHKHIHVAVALDELGARLDAQRFPADAAGYQALLAWASGLGTRLVFAIEGTGSYGAGLTSVVRRRDIGSSRSSAPTAANGACTVSPTPWTPRTPPRAVHRPPRTAPAR